jgi:hypothetical protein
MEYQITLTGPKPDVAAIQLSLHSLDPAALLAIDSAGRHLRVATSLPAGELQSLLRRNGLNLREGELQPQPSVCCGGCGG